MDLEPPSKGRNGNIKLCECLSIRVSISISFGFGAFMMIFIVLIVMENFSSIDIDSRVGIFLVFIYLLSYEIIVLIIGWSNEWSINLMHLISLLIGLEAITFCTIKLIWPHSCVLSTAILASGLLGSLIVLILYLLLLFHHLKDNNPSIYDYPLIDLNNAKYKEDLDTKEDPILDPLRHEVINEPGKGVIENTEGESKEGTEKESKEERKEIHKDSEEALNSEKKSGKENGKESEGGSGETSEKEIEESTTRELPAMHNSEIMKHMKVVEEPKVVWDKTHFIIGLESGGNS